MKDPEENSDEKIPEMKHNMELPNLKPDAMPPNMPQIPSQMNPTEENPPDMPQIPSQINPTEESPSDMEPQNVPPEIKANPGGGNKKAADFEEQVS